MRSYIFTVIIAFTILVSLFSCRSHQTFEVLVPAPYTLPHSIDTMLVVCCNEGMVWTDTSAIAKPEERTQVANSELRIPAVMGSVIFSQMNGDGFIPVKLYSKVTPFEHLPSVADILCRESNTNCILALKDINYNKEAYVLKGGMGFYYCQTVVKGSADFSFMTPDGEYMNFKPVEYFDTVFTVDYSEKDALENAPTCNESTFSFCTSVADQMVSLITPGWEQEHRWIFALPSYRFATIANLINSGSYPEARELLYRLYENGRRKNRLRAAINISLTYEMEGDINMAGLWCSKAMDIINSNKKLERSVCRDENYVDTIFSSLEKRKREILTLDRQMRRN